MFWDNFTKLCDEKGLKYTPTMINAGLASSSIARWQAGSAPNGNSLVKLAEYLNCSTDYLLTGQDFKPSDTPKPSYQDTQLLEMYHTLPDQTQTFIRLSIYAAYIEEMKKRPSEQKAIQKPNDLHK